MENAFEVEITSDNAFEPMSGFNDPVTAIATAVGKTFEAYGKVADASGKVIVAKTELKKLSGKRGQEIRDCRKRKEFKKFLDPKYRKNRIAECVKEVNDRNDYEQRFHESIIKQYADAETAKTELEKSKTESILAQRQAEQEIVKSDRKVIVGVSIGVGVLALGSLAFYFIKKRK